MHHILNRRTAVAGIVVLVGVGGLILSDGRDQRVEPEIGAPDVRETVRDYSAQQRELVRDHLDRALSLLEQEQSELAVAAAVNTYLHQYLLTQPYPGAGAGTLAAARGFCGNHAAAMVEMLYLAGIDARTAALLGIPSGAGNHSLVEVWFSDGDRGLFDPTHGAFFAVADDPVSLEELIDTPSLSVDSLRTDVRDKRTTLDAPVVPMRSIAADYREAGDAAEIVDGRVVMEWRRDFADNRGWGISFSGRELLTEVPVRLGDTWGSVKGGGSGGNPWDELSVEHTSSGRALAWAFQLGQSSGYEVAHELRLLGTRPGDRYVLRLHVASALGSPPRLRIRPPSGETMARTLEPLSTESDGWKPKRIDIPLIAPPNREPAVRVEASGSMLLQAIGLVDGERAARPASAPAS
jgi:hypothetical protein